MKRTRPSFLRAAAICAFFGFSFAPQTSLACGEGAFLGEVCMFAGTYCPDGFSIADGRLLNISQNTALYSLLSTRFGGDGITNFALPNLPGYGNTSLKYRDNSHQSSTDNSILIVCIVTNGIYPARPQ